MITLTWSEEHLLYEKVVEIKCIKSFKKREEALDFYKKHEGDIEKYNWRLEK